MKFHPLAKSLLEQIQHFSTYDELILALNLGLIQGPWRHHCYSGNASTHWWSSANHLEDSFVAVRECMTTEVGYAGEGGRPGFSRKWFDSHKKAYQAVLGASDA